MSTAIVDGKVVKVGDVVGFKSDTEQYGTIIAIKQSRVLVLENKAGFCGEYLRYATRTEELASDCWID